MTVRSIYEGPNGKSSDRISYTSHGFVHGDVVRRVGNEWSKSQAVYNGYSGTIGMVEAVIDANTFTIVYSGRMERKRGLGGAEDYIPGNTYYVSDDVPGDITDAPFGDIRIPVFTAIDEYGSGIVLAPTNEGDGNVITDVRGYFCGGNNSTPTVVNQIEGFKFSGETIIAVTATLNEAKNQGFTASSTGAGYIMEGQNVSGNTISIDCFNFSNETVQTVTNNQSIAVRIGAAVSDGVNGFLLGGYGSSDYTTLLQRFNFPSNTMHRLTATLSEKRGMMAGDLNDTTRGYAAGGWNGTANQTIVQGVTFATEALLTASGTVTSRRACFGTHSETNGYCIGGFTTGESALIERVTLSTGAVTSASNNLSSTQRSCGVIEDEDYAYFAGGVVGGTSYQTTIQRLKFSDETASTPSATLSAAVMQTQGISPRTYV